MDVLRALISACVVLGILLSPGFSFPRPTLTLQVSHTPIKGQSISLSCRVKHITWGPVEVEWAVESFAEDKRKVINAIPMDSIERSISTSEPKYMLMTYNESRLDQTFKLTVTDLNYDDDGIYECIVKTKLEEYSNDTTLLVEGPPVIYISSAKKNGMLGGTVNLQVKVQARPNLQSVEWYDPNGTELSKNLNRLQITRSEDSFFVHAYLLIKNFTKEDTGTYRAVATNERGDNFTEITLLADPYLEVVTPNDSNIFPLSSTAVFICRAMNFAVQPTLSWNLATHHAAISSPPNDVNVTSAVQSGTRQLWQSQIILRRLTYESVGELTCSTEQNHTEYSDSQNLNIIGIPKITPEQTTVKAAVGETVKLTCNITSNPAPKLVRWLFKTQVLRFHEYTKQETGDVHMQMSYNVQVVTESNFGTYTCEAQNSLGNIGHSIILTAKYINACPVVSCNDLKYCRNGKCICPKSYTEDDEGRCIETVSGNSSMELYLWIGVGAGGVLVLGLTAAIVFYVCWRRKVSRNEKKKLAEMARTNAVYTHAQYARPNIYEIITKPTDEFPRERLRFLHPVGVGKFGRVMKAEALSINRTGKWEEVAVKMCQESATDLDKEDLYNELTIIRKIPRHINVVSFFGACTYGEPLLLILEFVPKGDLREYLRRHRPDYEKTWDSPVGDGSVMRTEAETTSDDEGELTAKDLLSFALQAAQGMKHLETYSIVHRDVAARNVLVGYNCVCKISDFGLARSVEGVDVYERTSTGPLPIRWMAPESLMEGTHSHRADVWSFGILLWEIVTLGASPYSAMTLREVIDAVVAGKRLERPQHCMNELYSLMRNCWEHFPRDRPSFGDLVHRLEFLLEREADYIQLDQFQEAVYMVLEPDSMDERL